MSPSEHKAFMLWLELERELLRLGVLRVMDDQHMVAVREAATKILDEQSATE
jgi:hypothetical protein